MFRYLLIFLGLIGLAVPSPATPILKLIESGNIEEARKEIDRQSTAARRDGNLLFYQALLEENGAISFQFLEAAVKAGLSAEYLEKNTYMMALYHMADDDFHKLETGSAAYLQWWENGNYRPEMLRLDAFANKQIDKDDKANRLLGNLINEFEGMAPGAMGLLDRAQSLYEKKAYIEAQNICRRLANSRYDEVIAPALYMLSYYSIEQKRIDDAILYYNLLKEGYPGAIGLDDLVDKFTQIKKPKNTTRAEEITGTFYSIQVGVFSQRDNAKSQSKLMKKYGEPVEISEKIISDKKYFVVYVGRFNSTETAMALKARMEKSENEAFRVVAR